ncbi:MAG: alginate lyase family protein [Desulfobacter sp.]|nr:MAG: alginate lyase family protein [Desulfobacter sp.]
MPKVDIGVIKDIHQPNIKLLDLCTESTDLNDDVDFKPFEKRYCKTFFSEIKFGDSDPDIRSVWEPARLTSVTQALVSIDPQTDKDEFYRLTQKVISWIKENPFLFGVHYLSPMELGLRIQVFFLILKRIDPEEHIDEIEMILSAIYQHAWWISRNMALYSSLGNHTVCECVGLLFSGAVFRGHKEGQIWLRKGCRLLEQELYHQILDDGGGAEQSIDYHRFVLDLYWLSVDFLETNKYYDCSKWKERLKKGEIFWQSFLFNGCAPPMIGDSDSGYALGGGICPKRQLPGNVKKNHQGIAYQQFNDSGYSIIKTQSGVFITFDHGPLGMAPLYNHGHADALSITLSKNKLPFLIDPGTYRYNGVPEHRAYFKGTKSHNTICIDNTDQAEQLSGFIWDKPYTAELVRTNENAESIFLRAQHDGYTRLKNKVIHERDVCFYDGTCCVIKDFFSGFGTHVFEQNFHLHPDVEVIKEKNWLCLDNNGVSIFIYDPGNLFTLVRGQENPLLGWYSSEYGVLEETSTLHAVKSGVPNEIRFVTLIGFGEAQLEKAVKIYRSID